MNKRKESDFGNHPLDFEHKCCFREQIIDIGEGTKYGDGEIILVKMKSGKTANYRLLSERYSYTFENTGLKNWKYLFLSYDE